mmetsp:Transcript_37374/g.97978  ORF Transcript_37374/g.97978 Transcript_37374/m.97978 type:complete len:570 (-) Transcript_37374:56-1765(-)|eukprot:CAMPEP_0182920590 /NCGR_PEP_ID=MMETSP0105_2-20130417/3575_1 /TAXON_ID=81532 ORGANISM="Acanthoeca-like sp., Strain 10tr" /NCGR_SAMPLE_ID=MMETSP0105_2 /ASSEMBLY_ACC=CAM_ASM_000205 /LENGTH=569 /DNA_ID=CAMNT_0025058007 /DNA_START=24 /DNA_END=1733 /DNA_ORIENTATION=-
MAASAAAFRGVIEAALRGEGDLKATLPSVETDGVNSEPERREAIEAAFREVLRERIVAEKVDPTAVTSVIDVAISLAQAKLCSPTTPHTLLDDTFDMSVLEVCEHVFTFVESRLGAWSNEPFSGVGPRNVMLRLCNGLSARLSNTRDTVLSGRILQFLASVTPLQDKSGINMGSQFNMANVTVFDDEETLDQEKEDREAAAAAASAGMRAAEDDKPDDVPVDYAFYREFWTLQKYFTAPTLCYSRAGWTEFLKSLKAVMAWFSANKLDSAAGHAAAAAADDGEADAELPYFPKFLTSSKLFHLELADSGFRRQILVQLLVLFQYLTGEVKFKKETYKLTKMQADIVGKTRARVYTLLKTTPPNGDAFAEAVRKVLASEHVWIKWKNEKCPDFFREPGEVRKRKAFEGADGDGRAKKVKDSHKDLGSAEVTRLWNLTATNLDGCKGAIDAGRSIPEVGVYFKEAISQVAGEYPIDKRFWTFTEPAYMWRALRLLGKDRLHYFADFNHNKNSLVDYMETVVKKLATEAKQADKGDAAKGETASTAEESVEKPASGAKVNVEPAAAAPMEES